MDKIKTVKIKNPDGSVSEETYTISVDAKDVDMKNGKDLQDTIGDINVDRDGSIAEQLGKYKDYDSDIEILYADVDSLEAADTDLENDIIDLQVNKINKTDIIDNLNSSSNTKVLSAKQGKVLGDAVTALEAENIKKKAYFFDTVAAMKAANLHEGDYVCTLGYYTANDGGAAEYKITSTESQIEYQEELNNSLYATLIIKDKINVKHFGTKGDNNNDDYNYLQNAITYGLNHNFNIYIPAGKYKITQTLNIDNGITIELDDEAMIFCNNDIDLIKMKPYSKIKGGKLITNKSNYSKNLVSIISSPQQNIFGGIYNTEISAYNGFSLGSNGIKTIYEDNSNLCFFEIEDVVIKYFDCAINLSSTYTGAWCTTFNIGNVHMSYCNKYINMDMPRECSGHHIYNCSIQPVQNQNFDYILNMNNAKYNNIEIMCWDVQGSNTNIIRLSNTCNYNVLNLMPFEYNDSRITNNGADNSFISARMINNTYMRRNKFKTINLSSLDSTYAYPVVFKGLSDFIIDSQSSSGDGGLTIFAKVTPSAYGVRESYSCFEINQYKWAKKLVKIVTVPHSVYYAIYLQGGKNYTLIDNNFSEYMSYEIKTEQWTNSDLTVEPILLSSINQIKTGIYINFEPVEITNSSTPTYPVQ